MDKISLTKETDLSEDNQDVYFNQKFIFNTPVEYAAALVLVPIAEKFKYIILDLPFSENLKLTFKSFLQKAEALIICRFLPQIEIKPICLFLL